MEDKVVFNALLLDKEITDLKISILIQADKIKEMEEVVGNIRSHNASCVVKLGCRRLIEKLYLLVGE